MQRKHRKSIENHRKTQKNTEKHTPPGRRTLFIFPFKLNNSFHCHLKNDSLLPYFMVPFMNPFQPATCIISANFPVKYDCKIAFFL